MIMHKH